MHLTVQQIRTYASFAGFNNEGSPDLDIAVAIALAESGGDTLAIHVNSDEHKSSDLGAWQINDYWQKPLLQRYSWSDPAQNATMAWNIFKAAGYKWTPWSTFKSGAYRKFLPTAQMAQSDGHVVTVSKGDTVSHLAGSVPWLQVWHDPHNAALVRLRSVPERIQPGDHLFIPA